MKRSPSSVRAKINATLLGPEKRDNPSLRPLLVSYIHLLTKDVSAKVDAPKGSLPPEEGQIAQLDRE